ncbi:MAG: extracellular solute-binding protein, partial [Clostridia bacterium]|nr:extracellular solute-binding protein [Clostridia bacterium]
MNSKRFISLIAVLLVLVMSLATLLVGCDSNVEDTSATETLVVYNWEDYIDESEETSRLDAFAEYYKSITGKDIEIVYSTFDTNETMMTKVLNDDANSVDLICPSEYAIQKLMANGRLSSITDLVEEYKDEYDFNNLHLGTTHNSDATFVNAIEREFSGISTGNGTGDMADYMVPYMMGTLGILYNVQYVTEEDLEAGWGLLWNASGSEKLENMILVKDSVRDTYVAAVMYMREYGLLP